VPEASEILGLDKVKVPVEAYPEFLGGRPAPATPAE
jgi:hypothetical protein